MTNVFFISTDICIHPPTRSPHQRRRQGRQIYRRHTVPLFVQNGECIVKLTCRASLCEPNSETNFCLIFACS
jgi:hypothetical protein